MKTIKFDKSWLQVFDNPPHPDWEACGVLYGYRAGGNFEVTAIEVVPNRHPDPERDFRIHKSDVAGDVRSIIGFVHTHPQRPTHPSHNDVIGLTDDQIGVVYHPPSKTVTYYDRNGYINEEVIA